MKTTHSFSIDFLVRKCKEDRKSGFVYARITIDVERAEISLKEKIELNLWDTKSERARGKTTEAKALNEHITNVEFSIRQHYRTLLDTESLVTAESVKQAYLGVQKKAKGHKLVALLEFYSKTWAPKLAKGSFKNYKTTIDYIKRFLKHSFGGDIYLSQLSMEFVTLFESYVRENPAKQHDPCEGNGIPKHIQRFKRIVNWGVELKWVDRNEFEKYSCPVKKSKRKKLTTEMLVLIESKEFRDPMMAYVKDLFLYSCYTGLAFVDAMHLTEAHFEWDTDEVVWCKIYRKKSDEFSPVPLLLSAAAILKRYRTQNGEYNRSIFPKLTNQQVNRMLKMIGEICGIPIPLTFHVARHTFAKTVALKNGVPLETVQMMMGHAKITTTQIYADVDEEKIVDDMSTIEEKLNRKRKIVQEKYGLNVINNN